MIKYCLLTVVLLFYLSCQNAEKSTPTPDVSTVKELVTKTGPKVFVSIIGGLRVRDLPSSKGKVLGSLSYGQEVIDLEKESTSRDSIELRNKMRYDSWKKIRINEGTKQEVEGWAFGGGLMKYSAVYSDPMLNTIERKIVGANKDELSSILGLNISTGLFYDGVVRYIASDQGGFVKDGPFEVGGKRIDTLENYPFEFKSTVTGSYQSGVPSGQFIKTESVYEFDEEVVINFENGKCTWITTTHSSEGEDEIKRDDDPADCGF